MFGKKSGGGLFGSIFNDDAERRQKDELERKKKKLEHENKLKMEKNEVKREKRRQEKIQARRDKHAAKMHKMVNEYMNGKDAQRNGNKTNGNSSGINRGALLGGGAVAFGNALSKEPYDPNANPYEQLQKQALAASALKGAPKLRRG